MSTPWWSRDRVRQMAEAHAGCIAAAAVASARERSDSVPPAHNHSNVLMLFMIVFGYMHNLLVTQHIYAVPDVVGMPLTSVAIKVTCAHAVVLKQGVMVQHAEYPVVHDVTRDQAIVKQRQAPPTQMTLKTMEVPQVQHAGKNVDDGVAVFKQRQAPLPKKTQKTVEVATELSFSNDSDQGQFATPLAIVVNNGGELLVSDANNRIQVFEMQVALFRAFGGKRPMDKMFNHPIHIEVNDDNAHLVRDQWAAEADDFQQAPKQVLKPVTEACERIVELPHVMQVVKLVVFMIDVRECIVAFLLRTPPPESIQMSVEDPQAQHTRQVVNVAFVKQRQVPSPQMFHKTVEVPQVQHAGMDVDAAVGMQRQTPPTEEIFKTLDVPQALRTGQVVDVALFKQRRVLSPQMLHKTVEVPQVQHADMDVDAAVGRQRQMPPTKKILKTVDVPQALRTGQVVDVAIVKQRQAPPTQRTPKTVKVLQVQHAGQRGVGGGDVTRSHGSADDGSHGPRVHLCVLHVPPHVLQGLRPRVPTIDFWYWGCESGMARELCAFMLYCTKLLWVLMCFLFRQAHILPLDAIMVAAAVNIICFVVTTVMFVMFELSPKVDVAVGMRRQVITSRPDSLTDAL